MNKNHVTAFFVGAGLLAASLTAVAHHSVSAEFDTNKKVTFTGVVKKVDWMNPHIYTHVEVKEADGKTIVYKVEGGAPNSPILVLRRIVGVNPDVFFRQVAGPNRGLTRSGVERYTDPDFLRFQLLRSQL